MSILFEEIDYSPTAIGPISLRRRREPVTGAEVYEVKLGEDHLMSSLFTASERALGALGTRACKGEALDIVVGGLGLGYTAQAVLADARVSDLLVVEYLAPVIEWHQKELVPLGCELNSDRRCRFVEGDFFAMANSEDGFDPSSRKRTFDAVLVDIDHSPEALLDCRSAGFYSTDGLGALIRHLKPGGIFGLWSNDERDEKFIERLSTIFESAWAEPVTFDNPLQGKTVTQSVYLARTWDS